MRRLSNGYVTPIRPKHPRALRFEREIKPTYADMAERLIAAVLKTVDAKASQGSNPCVRASLNDSVR